MFIDFDNIDFSKSQRIFFWGDPGKGKTLLLCKLVQDCMIQSLMYCYKSFDEIDYLNEIGYNFSKKFEHLAFSNFNVNSIGSLVPDLLSYKVNPFKLGFKGKCKTDLYPTYSSFFITEFQNYVPANMNDYLRPEYVQFYQTSRHYGLSFFVDAQRPTDVAKKIRDLFDYYVEFVDVKEIIKDDVCVGHNWKLRIINNSRVLEEYLRTNNQNLCKEIIYYFNRCLYDNYDSYFCKMLHLKDRKNEDFCIQCFGDNIDNDLEILTAPPDFYVTKIDRVQNNYEGVEILI